MLSSRATTTIPFPHTPTTSLPSPPTRISFPTRPTKKPTLTQTRATTKDGLTQNETVSQQISLYDLLGIPETGSLPEIKQAYKQLARIYHPDVSPPGRVKEYTERFIRVQEAYETLSDPRRRAVYDRDLSRGFTLAFSARKTNCGFNEDGSCITKDMEDKSDWKTRWQSQLSGLKNRRMHKEEKENMSWGARMRRQRNES